MSLGDFLFQPKSHVPAIAFSSKDVVAVFPRELLSWYLVTLKLRETVVSAIPKSPIGNAHPIEFPEQPQQELPGENCKEETKSLDSEWVISINKNLEQARQDDATGSWAKLCIYRVPQYLREGNDEAYVPQLVSLASYHHGKNRLRQMDRHKWRSLHHVLKRTNKDIKLFLDSIRELEEKAHSCCEVSIAVNSNEFVEMMVLDGFFVLELAAEGFKQLGNAGNDPVYIFKIK